MDIHGKLKFIKSNWLLYVFMIPAIVYFILFRIWPLIEMKLAFEDYRIVGNNVWVGMKYFKLLFSLSRAVLKCRFMAV
jgi:putative aldouronate transport system permease protein